MSVFAIAGVTGHVGSVAARELLGQGHKVRVLVRAHDKGSAWRDRGAEVAIGSLENEADVTAFLRGADGAFLLLPPNMGVADFYGWQRETGATIARGVAASGIGHVVVLSSQGADRATDNGPVKGLFHFENALRATGLKLTSLRPGMFAENNLNSLPAAQGMGIWPNLGPPDYPVPQIATRDIAKYVVRYLVDPPGKSSVIDLLGPPVTARQIADSVGKALGKSLNVVNVPPEGHVQALLQAGVPQQMAEAYTEMYAGFAAGLIRPVGDQMFQATTTLDEVLADNLAR